MGAKKIKVIVHSYGERIELQSVAGRQLKGLLQDSGIRLSLPCGGMGRCGKCRVRFLNGAPAAISSEQGFISEGDLALGYRLLCKSVLTSDCEIELGEGLCDEDGIAAETIKVSDEAARDFDSYFLAVDIGTTTIAAALVGSDSKGPRVIDTASGINHQRRFGSDVISRISAASDIEIARELRNSVLQDLSELLSGLSAGEKITEIAICGNTTMLHLLRGYDISGLGKYPYKTEHLAAETVEPGKFWINGVPAALLDAQVRIMPGITAFVGADIVSGIYGLDMCKGAAKALLIDLGTNGEMAYWNGKELRVTSTAAGPVFEGGGIRYGMASIPGAIAHVDICEVQAGHLCSYETIGDEPAIGICGTGVLEAVSELVRNGMVSQYGLLTDDFFEKGFPITNEIAITQQDIRSVQLAKAAIYTGIKTLLAGDEPDVVYIAGGFGTHIDVEKIMNLQMFPAQFSGKIVAKGNTALMGCVKYLSDKENAEPERICSISSEIVLAAADSFDEEYVAAMNF